MVELIKAHAELIAACKWYSENGLDHERMHFLAVEAEGDHGLALARLAEVLGE